MKDLVIIVVENGFEVSHGDSDYGRNPGEIKIYVFETAESITKYLTTTLKSMEDERKNGADKGEL